MTKQLESMNIFEVVEAVSKLASRFRPGFERIIEIQPELKDMTKEDLARLMAAAKSLHELMDSNKTFIGKLYDGIRVVELPEVMENDGVTSFSLEGIGRIGLTDDLRVTVIDKAGQFTWLEETGNGDMITETVNASSLKALLRRKMKAGEEIPTDIFDIGPFTRASITKS